jgi:circadian clock protein KaiC
MTAPRNSVIRNVATGVPGLDAVLGGGLCEYSFNLIAGSPGAGKTTLVQQILFANATEERPAVYFTVLGEPTVKMMRYQQQFGFFETSKVPSAIRFVNLSAEAARGVHHPGQPPVLCGVDPPGPALVAGD